jgi:nitrite reductase/ring-hydroxylating ferredoxin subunit
MVDATAIADVEDVPETGSFLFTAEDAFTNETELILVRCDDGPRIEAWVNNCTHENQRLDRGEGAAMRDGEIICPRHGSMFDACTGDCENGEAAGTTLPGVDITVEDGTVYLTDDHYTFCHVGQKDRDEGPDSTSHISF